MEVFRIHSPAYHALDGSGAALHEARWNPPGSPVVYAALHYEGAILEQLVHAGIGRLPRNRVVSRIEVPETTASEELEGLDDGIWHDEARTREMGAAWLESRTNVALLVPSAVARPVGLNVLVNPSHPDFEHVRVVETIEMRWDPRLDGR